jgi:hypothetical protein
VTVTKCGSRIFSLCAVLTDFSGMKKSGDTPLMLHAPTARRVPTETGFKLRMGSELPTIERLPVCYLGDHFWSEWGERQSALAAADSVQTEIARHEPMIRCARVSDGRLRRRQALREYEVKGGIPGTRDSLGGSLVYYTLV